MALKNSFLRKLQRRKHVDAAGRPAHQLAKNLSVIDLVSIGIGSTIGAGVYVLVGTVAKERTGPALAVSFLIAGLAATLSAFCYAELASRCPSAGSAYHYSYLCVGEGVAWLIGWALILEYTVGGSAVARGISPNLALLIGEDNMPLWLSRTTISGTEIVVDPCAGLLVILVTILLCAGVKESATVQSIVTSLNVLVLIFVVAAGAAIGFKTNWIGYRLTDGYLPFGVNGLFGGAATLFFSYIGFDTVASTAEEVKNPQRDLPLGIGIALSICACLYMLVSVVITGIVPYDEMDTNTPISAAFSRYGVDWAMYIVSAGAVTALFSTLMGSLLPQPRILMAMARDGLLPRFFLNISKRTWIPVNGTLTTGFIAAVMASLMNVDQLSGMVSVGTLLAFTIVGVSILILRYVSPAETRVFSSSYLPPSTSNAPTLFRYETSPVSLESSLQSITVPFFREEEKQMSSQSVLRDPEYNRRLAAIISISACTIGSILFAVGACGSLLPSWLRWSVGSVGTCIFLTGGIVLVLLEQDEGRHTFGRSGGFICPFVPWLPLLSILINVYLLADLGLSTWMRVGIWLLVGVLIYLLYGIKHSMLSAEECKTTLEEHSVISTITS